MKSAVEILECATELLSDPARWAKGFYAFDKDGNRVSEHGTAAASFCLIGALRHCAGETAIYAFDAEYYDARLCISAVTSNAPSIFNDSPGTTHADLMAALEKATEKARAA